MATIRILLGIFCFTIISSTAQPHRYIIKNRTKFFPSSIQITQRQHLLAIARSQIGIREWSGKNDGIAVKTYLAYVNLKEGNPWCAAFVSWVFSQAGLKQPKTGWCPDLFPKDKQSKAILPGNLLGIYFSEKKRIAHVGIVERKENKWVISIEGNTNLAGSREGDGVYRKRRLVKTIKYFANWPVEKEGVR